MTRESKRPSHRVRDEMKVKEASRFLDRMWAAGDVSLNLCRLFFFFFLPSSSSHRASLHLYQETPSTLQLMVDKPSRPDLAWTRLLFIPSLPVPTPPPRPGFSWQALISLTNRLQTWGFAIPHRAAHGIWPSFQREHGATRCNSGTSVVTFRLRELRVPPCL